MIDFIQLHLTLHDNYSTIDLYLTEKGGYDARNGNILHSRGGGTGFAHQCRDGETLHQTWRIASRIGWGSLSHIRRGLRAICTGAQNQEERQQIINAGISPATPGILSIRSNTVDSIPMVTLPSCNVLHGGGQCQAHRAFL